MPVISIMLPLISTLIGLTFFVSFSVVLWIMLARPTNWAKLTSKEHEFWIRRGLPVKWAGVVRDADRGWVLKVLVAFTIILAAILTVTAMILPFIVYLYA